MELLQFIIVVYIEKIIIVRIVTKKTKNIICSIQIYIYCE